jgi:hypothetical protein
LLVGAGQFSILFFNEVVETYCTFLLGPLTISYFLAPDLLDVFLSKTDPLTFLKEGLVLGVFNSLKFGVGSAVLTCDDLILTRSKSFAHHATE